MEMFYGFDEFLPSISLGPAKKLITFGSVGSAHRQASFGVRKYRLVQWPLLGAI